MEILSWRQVDFAGVALASVVAGYVMAVAGLWAGRVPGLTSVDVADFGRRYMISDRPSAWLFGLVAHLFNSTLLVFLWAAIVVPNLPWPGWLLGTLYGLALAIFLAGALVTPMAGLGFLGRKAGGWSYGLTSVLIHLIWGLLIGVIYVPR